MSEVATHYESLLARHYTWMLGGDFDELVAEQRQLLDSLDIRAFGKPNRTALDLGCGSGIQSIALAQLGHDTVVGVDVSPTLLAEMTARTTAYPAVRPVHADLCSGLDSIVAPQSVTTVVCMGDTLPHLPDTTAVRRLVEDVFDALVPGGAFVLTFRDLTTPLSGLDRFIQVRTDPERIMTCFLEDEGDAVRVHDLVHTRDADGTWQFDKSSYRKLRLPTTWVRDLLHEAGFVVAPPVSGPRGLRVVTARRPEHASS
ncbi:class I SAM-dependent methyltransferase [Micromonospora sp. URMC 103]|uniref:class I SAM-dependent methyltransferase n=1 Tax=Micromonospora sp. URMC 103 TaxID=3423406 RepID=UPI003F19E919